VFPSLHIAVSLFLWLTLLKDYRRLGLLLTPLLVLLWASTIYLRYHYCIDLIAGVCLAVGVFGLTAGGTLQNRFLFPTRSSPLPAGAFHPP
jgi:membrane-associated phospholipid phosphatase